MGKQQSLYSIELKRYGDERSAYMATQAHMLNAMQAQLTGLGMQAQSAQSQASINQAQQQIEIQKMQVQRELSNRLATAQLYGAFGGEGGISPQQAAILAVQNPKQAQGLIGLENGRNYQFRGTPEQAQDYRNFEQTTGSVLDQIDQLKRLGSSASIPGSDSNRKAQVLINNLETQIPQLRSSQIGAKRINEVEADRASKIIPDPRHPSGWINGVAALDQFARGIKQERENARASNLWNYQAPQPLRTFRPD